MKEEHLERMLTVIVSKLNQLLKKADKIMSTENDLEVDLQAISDAIDVLAKEIADLKAAGSGAVTQAQLDALDVKAKAIADAAQKAV